MKKSISSSALSDRSPVSLSPSMTPPSSRPRTATTVHAMHSSAPHYSPPDLSSASTEAVAEAFVRTTIPNIAVCTELYGFPNEVLQKNESVVNQYVSCLMQPEEVVTTDEEVHPIPASQSSSLTRMLSADPERVARLFLIERRRRRRWSIA